MNDNPLLGQVLGGLFGGAGSSGSAGNSGGGLGGMLGGILGRASAQSTAAPAGAQPASNDHDSLLVRLLPLAMRWMQGNGGIGTVLDKLRQQGLGAQAQSWVSNSTNQPVDPPAVRKVVGDNEVQQMAQHLGVPEQQVTQGLAQILPHLVDQLTPQGHVPQQADSVLAGGLQRIEQELQGAQQRESAPS